MKRPRCVLLPQTPFSRLLLIFYIISSSVPGSFSTETVTLGSIQIFKTHEFLARKPTIYFYCKGENKIILPDVKEKHFLYTFKGKESWQPLTELTENKCKRCGLYEMDRIKSDDVFDEWELCLDDFIDGKSIHFKEKEFNATFICEQCRAAAAVPVVDSGMTSSSKSGSANKKMNVVLVMVISALVSVIAAAGTVGAYKYWQKRKREQDQARFLKLFEDGDDIEDELGIRILYPDSGSHTKAT
ncbi:uncharacterized protein [Elaeis guineensis]|uniref:Uncharacterized protein LOC105045764 isoform X1 n=1 Tax=Elaeis guineensis var. tenera TaxID=51953 RepID=A0A6I9R894_ELAGV|nr:uncharacterized protein LOC105045764 isoform X1 [Elaeis guineensis]